MRCWASSVASLMIDVGPVIDEGEHGVSIDPALIGLLRCPDVHKAPLTYEDDRLTCTECGRTYEINDGVPVMLIEDEDQSS